MKTKTNENQLKRMIGRIIGIGYYSMQDVRKSIKNEIRDIVRKKAEEIKFDEVEEKKKDKKYDKKYNDNNLFLIWDDLLKKEKITQQEHDYLVECWELAKKTSSLENQYKTAMLEYVESEPVYVEFLAKIRGIAEVLSANLIKEFGDCRKYKTISSLWCHTGNHVLKSGIAPYPKKNMRYDPKLKTMTWKISDCLMKANKGVYRQIYDREKRKQLEREYKEGELYNQYKDKYSEGKGYKREDLHITRGHAHNRALRKMRKVFLANYWQAARELNGLDTEGDSDLYIHGKGSHKHIIDWREAIAKEGIVNKTDIVKPIE